jgi:hypothetical protein
VVVGEKDDMIKLQKLLQKENYGANGEMVLPKWHKAGMKVPKGGSCCANCKYWDTEQEVCTSEYYKNWAGTDTIPYKADEYCTNWWEPIEKESDEEETTNQ